MYAVIYTNQTHSLKSNMTTNDPSITVFHRSKARDNGVAAASEINICPSAGLAWKI